MTLRKWVKVSNDITNGKPISDFLSMVNSNHMGISDHFQVVRHFVFDLEKWVKVTNDITNGKPISDFLSMVNSNHMVISDRF